MKKFILLAMILVSGLATAQLKITEAGSVIWQKVYDQHIDLAGQDEIALSIVGEKRMRLPIWLIHVQSAKIKAEHKDGKTRITAYDIFYDSPNFGKGYADDMATKAKKGKLVIRKTFNNLAFEPLNRIISRKVNEIVESSDW